VRSGSRSHGKANVEPGLPLCSVGRLSRRGCCRIQGNGEGPSARFYSPSAFAMSISTMVFSSSSWTSRASIRVSSCLRAFGERVGAAAGERLNPRPPAGFGLFTDWRELLGTAVEGAHPIFLRLAWNAPSLKFARSKLSHRGSIRGSAFLRLISLGFLRKFFQKDSADEGASPVFANVFGHACWKLDGHSRPF